VYATIIEKTGWTVEEISKLNINTVNILVAEWTKNKDGKKTDKSKQASVKDIKMFQNLVNNLAPKK